MGVHHVGQVPGAWCWEACGFNNEQRPGLNWPEGLGQDHKQGTKGFVAPALEGLGECYPLGLPLQGMCRVDGL